MAYNTSEERLLKALKDRADIGACGSVYIDNTDAVSGNFVAVTALEDSTSLNYSGTASDIDDLDANMAIPTGVTVFGEFTAVQLATGKAIAYKKCVA